MATSSVHQKDHKAHKGHGLAVKEKEGIKEKEAKGVTQEERKEERVQAPVVVQAPVDNLADRVAKVEKELHEVRGVLRAHFGAQIIGQDTSVPGQR